MKAPPLMVVAEPEIEQQTRKLLMGAAAGTVAGLMLSVLGQATVGSVVTLAGLVTLVTSIHRLGRLGPDAGRRRARLRSRKSRSAARH